MDQKYWRDQMDDFNKMTEEFEHEHDKAVQSLKSSV